MADIQTFPVMWEDFVKTYEFRDKDELYTNGAMLIPSFRVEQMVKHYFAEPMSRPKIVRCRDCKYRAGANVQAVVSDLCMWLDIIVKPDGFCAWGERKEVSE